MNNLNIISKSDIFNDFKLKTIDYDILTIGEYLVKTKKITEPQLEDALLIQKFSEKRLGEILIEKGHVGENDIAFYLAQRFNHDYFESLEDNFISVNKKENERFGFDFLYQTPAILIKKGLEGYIVCNGLTAGLSEKIAFDEELKGFKIGISAKSKIYEALNRIFINKSGNFPSEKEMLNEAIEMALIKNSPNIRIKRAENFYLIIVDTDSGRETIRILTLEQGQRVINIIAASCQVTLKKGEGLDAKFIFESNSYKGIKTNIRAAFLPISSKLDKEMALFEAVLRVHGFNKVFDLKYTGINSGDIEILNKIYTYPNGFVISTGPTGSGKTTTFYAILKLLAQKQNTIITIEDPVEVELKESNITQMNISDEFGYSEAIKVMLRCEPRIMMVGEIRDEMTAKHSLIAAETGHLVLATLHTNSALSTFNRLSSLNVDLSNFFPLVRLVTSQRLYNPLCPKCKRKIHVERLPNIYKNLFKERNLFNQYPNKSIQSIDRDIYENYVFVRGETACNYCGGSGYAKRKPMIEIAEFNDKVKEKIYENLSIVSNYSQLERILVELSNFKPLKEQALKALLSGEIDPATYFTLSG